jgi:hypothetical protein
MRVIVQISTIIIGGDGVVVSIFKQKIPHQGLCY